MEKPISVLIVDDAGFMRKAVCNILESDQQIEVVGTARDGLEGLEKIKSLKPDVVTMDIDMPRMDGLAAVRHIMIESPVPVVVLSSLFSDGVITFEALRLGVVDFVPKPSGAVSADIDQSKQKIIDRIKIASSVNLANIRRVKLKRWDFGETLSARYGFHALDYILAIGTNLTGPNTVIRILSHMAPSLPAAVIVVQEISPKILPAFVQQFNKHVPWNVEATRDGVVLEQGTCYIGSNEHSWQIQKNNNGQACIRQGPKTEAPLDRLFSSAADIYRHNTIGVLLTGIGQDGAEGFKQIRTVSGMTLVQDSECCVYPNLTHNVIQKGIVDYVLDEKDLPVTIQSLMS